jgi:DNA-binding transcriptional LysR family regulator
MNDQRDDLVTEGVDVALLVGRTDGSSATARRLGARPLARRLAGLPGARRSPDTPKALLTMM